MDDRALVAAHVSGDPEGLSCRACHGDAEEEPVSAERQRYIEIKALSRIFNALFRMTPEKGIKIMRVRMDRNGKHIRSSIKNRLRTVAMMNINVEYGSPREQVQ